MVRKAYLPEQIINNPFSHLNPDGKTTISIQQTLRFAFFPHFQRTEALRSEAIQVEHNRWATEAKTLSAMTELGRGDIFVFFGHGSTHVLETVLFFHITATEIQKALESDRDAPSVVILSGCRTSGLLDMVIAAGAQIAIGPNRLVSKGITQSQTDVLIEKLVKGEPIERAISEVNRDMIFAGGVFEVKTASGIDLSKSLQDNGLLPPHQRAGSVLNLGISPTVERRREIRYTFQP